MDQYFNNHYGNYLGNSLFCYYSNCQKKSNERKKAEMDNFFASLHEGEKVMLLSGVVGTIKNITKNYVDLKVTDNAVVRVNKHGIASKIKNETK